MRHHFRLQFNYAHTLLYRFNAANIALENIVVLEESVVTSDRMHLCYLKMSDFNATELYQDNNNHMFRFKCRLWKMLIDRFVKLRQGIYRKL